MSWYPGKLVKRLLGPNPVETTTQTHRSPVHMKFDVEGTLKWAKARAERYDATAEVVYMTPEQVLRKMPSKVTVSASAAWDEERHYSKSSLDYLTAKAEKGEFFEPPYLDYTDMWYGWPGHEGRHRAFLAKKFGMEEIPVIIIKP